jgi:hypothetical protein
MFIYISMHRRFRLWHTIWHVMPNDTNEAAQQRGVAWEVEKLEAIENDRPAVLVACVSQETDHVDQEDHMT